MSREWYDRAIRDACAAVKRPGREGRDTRVHPRAAPARRCEAVNAGADPAIVSVLLGHKSPRTTRRFYATHASQAKVPTLA